ncbi:alpha/beta fold hydrolase [Jiangella alba]|uniref:Pimeloyl-ACP methyl ester carboxylesterase n=1 Tax=Jiangella alba TaxID=561176 RepID=A0A1H5KNE3_9ACTN|nr:alpha/beta hydrolase [Jiangella alba]SEE66273.1 Pimeloyl-ACP methyl ester carboxylesterase [Jiangella alba]
MTYTELNGARCWVAEDGAGPPLVLLHGGFSDGREFTGNLAGLAGDFRVVRPDRRGHGRSPDVDGPLSQHVMADDTVALLSRLGGPARLAGYSDGAVVALLTALRRPDLVERLVLISGVFDPSGWLFAAEPGPDDVDDDPLAGMPAEVVDAYAEVSPDGRDHFPVVAAKIMALTAEELGITPADLARLDVRTLVVAADDDIIALEHTLALYRALPRGELAVVPGTSHDLLTDKPAAVTAVVAEFLTHDAVPTSIPVRRASDQPR